jgi:hypothetical protein
MSNKKQTAVEWLVSKLPLGVKGALIDRIEEAEEMEKEQIIDAYAQGFIESESMDKGAEQYYNEIYK